MDYSGIQFFEGSRNAEEMVFPAKDALLSLSVVPTPLLFFPSAWLLSRGISSYAFPHIRKTDTSLFKQVISERTRVVSIKVQKNDTSKKGLFLPQRHICICTNH